MSMDTMAQQQTQAHANIELHQLASDMADCGDTMLEMNEEIAKQREETCVALQDVAKDS